MPEQNSPQESADFNLPEAYHALVLLIDDQAFVADAIRRAFAKQKDIDFHYCSTAVDAIRTAEFLKPTVILLDLIMPEVSGLSLLKQMREHPATSETPIVVLSGKEEPRTKSEAFALGANDYLVKLPDTIELRARVRYHSKAHLNRLQREEAFRALRESQQQLMKKNTELSIMNQELQQAIAEVERLQGLLPICSFCKKVRDDQNYWHQIETYVSQHSGVTFSHSLCPECFALEMKKAGQNNPETDTTSTK
jgi:PleD family two-component response regulator